jgi:hypothetical protein
MMLEPSVYRLKERLARCLGRNRLDTPHPCLLVHDSKDDVHVQITMGDFPRASVIDTKVCSVFAPSHGSRVKSNEMSTQSSSATSHM